jgi:hypothetical protein
VRRHVTDSPGGCKLVAEPSPENESEKLELAVIDKSLVFDEFLFATHLDRCRYIGTSARDRSQWLKDNVGKWHRIRDVQQEAAPLWPRAECESNVEAIPAGWSSPTSPGDVRNKSDDDGAALLVPAEDRSPAYKPPSAMAPQAIVPPPLACTTESEIMIGTRRFVSDQRVASMLGCSRRTLSRWHAAGKGPSRKKISSKLFYDLDKLQEWLESR